MVVSARAPGAQLVLIEKRITIVQIHESVQIAQILIDACLLCLYHSISLCHLDISRGEITPKDRRGEDTDGLYRGGRTPGDENGTAKMDRSHPIFVSLTLSI